MRINVNFGNAINTTTDAQKAKQTKANKITTNPYKEHTSIMHSKQGYTLMKEVANASIGAFGTLALLQTIDNRALKKNGKAFFRFLPKTLKFALTIAGGVGAVYLSKLIGKHEDKAFETIAKAHSNTIDFEINKNDGNI